MAARGRKRILYRVLGIIGLIVYAFLALNTLGVIGGNEADNNSTSASAVPGRKTSVWLLDQRSLRRIDGATGREGESYEVGGRALATTSTRFWIATEDGRVTEVSRANGKVIKTVATGGKQSNNRTLAVDGNDVWVCDENNGLWRVTDGKGFQVTLPVNTRCVSVVVAEGQVFIARKGVHPGLYKVTDSEIDPELASQEEFDATGLVVTGGSIYDLTLTPNPIYRINPKTGALTFIANGPANDLAAHGNDLWFSGSGGVVRFDGERKQFVPGVGFEGDRNNLKLATGRQSLWVAGQGLHIIDFTAAKAVTVVKPPTPPRPGGSTTGIALEDPK